jgi:hypothetical protein
MRLLLFLIFLIVLYTLAVAFLLFPRVIQAFAIRLSNAGMASNSPVMRGYFESRGYIIQLRAIGLLALLGALFLTFAALRRDCLTCLRGLI